MAEEETFGGKMRRKRFTMKPIFFSVLLFTGILLSPENSSAQACEYSWPTIGDNWRLGPDNYYTFRDVVGDAIATSLLRLRAGER